MDAQCHVPSGAIAPTLTLKSDCVQYDQFKEAQSVKGLPGEVMQAYKLKGAIDKSGHLIITEPIEIPAGEVEVIVLQSSPTEDKITSSEEPQTTTPKKRRTSIKAFQDLFENTEPAPPDFDPDQARWEALKEKYDL
jgi:hypothetical protein